MLMIGATKLRLSMRPILIRLGLMIVLLLLAVPAYGQAVTGEIVSVGLGGEGGGEGMYRQGCYVPVKVLLTNASGRNMDIYLAVEQTDADGDKIVSMSKRQTLNATDSRRSFWFYYWPRQDDEGDGTHTVMVLDAAKNPLTTINVPNGHSANGLPPIDESQEHSNRMVVLLGNKADGFEQYVAPRRSSMSTYGAKGGNATVRFTGISRADDFPDDVQGLDGVDVVIWACQNVPVADMRDEFQLKALLDWVRMGGHLILSVGTDYSELQDARHAELRDALPMRFTGTRQLDDSSILEQLENGTTPPISIKMTQVVGTLAPGAHVVSLSPLQKGQAPLLVSRRYGAGTISLLTVDLAMPDLAGALPDTRWLQFWQNTACWGGTMMTKAEVEMDAKLPRSGSEPTEVHAGLDMDVASAIDLKSKTVVRLLLAVFFLAVYWLIAGPVGHIVLRIYKKVHWSWWIFGATVVVASAVAIATVSFMRLGSYELKHRTYVVGTVGNSEALVVGYYGLFSPTEHRVKVELPPGQGYIVPFTDCLATTSGTFPPETYTLENGLETVEGEHSFQRPNGISFPARSTLKKLQARWYGSLATDQSFGALDVRARVYRNPVPVITRDKEKDDSALAAYRDHLLVGALRNRTPYTLDDVMVIAYADRDDIKSAQIYDFKGGWKPQADMDLARDLQHRETPSERYVNQLGEMLRLTGISYAKENKGASVPSMGGSDWLKEADERSFVATQNNPRELLCSLLDMRNAEGPRQDRAELIRQFSRGIDRSATLRASHLLILAVVKSEHDKTSPAIPSPLELTVDGTKLAGDGDIYFAWSADVE